MINSYSNQPLKLKCCAWSCSTIQLCDGGFFLCSPMKKMLHFVAYYVTCYLTSGQSCLLNIIWPPCFIHVVTKFSTPVFNFHRKQMFRIDYQIALNYNSKVVTMFDCSFPLINDINYKNKKPTMYPPPPLPLILKARDSLKYLWASSQIWPNLSFSVNCT